MVVLSSDMTMLCQIKKKKESIYVFAKAGAYTLDYLASLLGLWSTVDNSFFYLLLESFIAI